MNDRVLKGMGSPSKQHSKAEVAEQELFGAPKKSHKKYKLEDFKIITSLARGAFGFVFLVKHIPTQQDFVLK
jgi:hypothetical protein